jgi:DNA-binding transcriptional LysR family regulator
MPSGKLYHWEFERRGEQLDVDVPGKLTLDNDSLMVEAVLEGLGLAFVSDFWVAGHLGEGTLQDVLEDWTPPFPGLRLYYPRHRHMTAGLRAFVDMLREEARAATKRSRPPRPSDREVVAHALELPRRRPSRSKARPSRVPAIGGAD